MFCPKCLSKKLKDEKYYLTCRECRFSNSKNKWEKEVNLKISKDIQKD